ncbi:hypothetical protein HOLleu_26221 [Holothuria leucospilota]|uniref:Uncharacterized protein n=1 Tax=Holothuria leucospilota TaxID=206669 RepID=A0A9Q1BU05_HOLLE|nr:hypothetical protein HOLleu_26221 [Holothuria leucospilota]
MTEIKNIEERRQQVKQEKQNRKKEMYDSLRREKEKEIQGVQEKYDEIFKVELIDLWREREFAQKSGMAGIRIVRCTKHSMFL